MILEEAIRRGYMARARRIGWTDPQLGRYLEILAEWDDGELIANAYTREIGTHRLCDSREARPAEYTGQADWQPMTKHG